MSEPPGRTPMNMPYTTPARCTAVRTDGRSLPARASMSMAPPKPAGAAPVAASSEN
jgi:hypothetical protein